MYYIDYERTRFIGGLLRNIEKVIYRMVRNDPQYIAIDRINKSLERSVSVLLVIGNSIVSYMLSSRGEDYWTVFAEYMSSRDIGLNNLYEIHSSFLLKYNKFNYRDKLRRIHRFYTSSFASKLSVNPTMYCSDLLSFNRSLAKVLGNREDAKTIVFATKMYLYYCLANGLKPDVPQKLSIPVDRRNTLLSLTSCIVRGCSSSYNRCVDELRSRYSGIVIEAWDNVCRVSHIPCLLLDTFTWIVTGIYGKYRRISEIYRVLVDNYLVKENKYIYMVLEELFRCSR